jgi:hypothetical protein
MRRKNKRSLKKYLRLREKMLEKNLSSFLENFNLKQPFDSPEDNLENFRLLLKLRWLIYDFINLRLKVSPKWKWKEYFLELMDVEEINIENDEVSLLGDVVWWAEGKDAVGKWWNDDREPHKTGVYKVKVRGDMNGGYWLLEPVTVKLRKSKTAKQNASYEIDFGKASTYLKIRNK